MRRAKFGRDAGHRKALLRNLVSSLLLEERIKTTDIKAKAVKSLADKMITLGKRGDLHARRQAAAFLGRPEAVAKLFDEIAPRYTGTQWWLYPGCEGWASAGRCCPDQHRRAGLIAVCDVCDT
jgi:large subunit ribosomal protein L17